MKKLGSIIASKRQHAFGKRTNGYRRPKWRRLGDVERLEPRQLLAANPLATFSGAIIQDGGTGDINLTVDLPDAGPAGSAVIGVIVTAPSGSSFAPAAPTLETRQGVPQASVRSVHDPATRMGVSLFHVGPGDYAIGVGSHPGRSSSGDYQVQLFLPGDVLNADGRVDQREYLQATAAVVQNLGRQSHVARLFYNRMGIHLPPNHYDAGLDANRDGAIDNFDLAQVQRNVRVGRVTAELTGVQGPPVIEVKLQDDTGVEASDGITTDPSIIGTITDDGQVESFLIGIDGAPSFELLDLLDPLDASGEFVLSADDLETINGEPLAEGKHTLRFEATDDLGEVTSPAVELTFILILDNQTPTLDVIPNQQIDQDSAFSLDLSNLFNDADTDDSVILTVTGPDGADLPEWLEFDPDTNVLSGTPGNGDVGNFTVEVTATDSQNASTSRTFVITVNNVNDAPTVTDIPNQVADEDAPFELDISEFFEDVDAGDTLTFSVELESGLDLPNWLSFDSATGVFSGTPTGDDLGDITVIVTATDGASASVSDDFVITVSNVNDSPVLVEEIPDQQAEENKSFLFDAANFFNDPDIGDPQTYEAVRPDGNPLPDWLTFNTGAGIFSGTPGDNDIESFDVEVTVTDSFSASASDTFKITVVNVNDPPTISEPIPDQNVVEGTPFEIDIRGFFEDVDPGDQLTFSASLAGGAALPDWIQIDNGILSGLATNDDVGTITIEVTAIDQEQESVTDAFELTVINANDPPTVVSDIPNDSVEQDALYSLDVSTFFADIDPGDVLTFSATDTDGGALPTWLSINPTSGLLTGTPTNADVGTITIQVTASDSASATATTSFSLDVIDINDAPQVQIRTFNLAPDSPNGTVVGTVTATDPDQGDTLRYAVVAGDPDGVFSIEESSGEIRVVDASQLGEGNSFVLSVEVTDSGTPELSTTGTITIRVAANSPPEVSEIPDQELMEGTTDPAFVDVSQWFSDPDGDTLVYSATLADGNPLPNWLSLDPDTGVFGHSLLDDGEVGTISVEVTATDTANNEVSATFDVTVVNVNDAPQPVGSIPAQFADEDSPFQLDLATFFDDPDLGDVLSFAVTMQGGGSMPSWLQLSQTGLLTGTPTNDDFGTVNLAVTVTDTSSASAQQPFSLTVNNTNDPPTPVDDEGFSTANDTTLGISISGLLANDSDPDPGETLTLQLSDFDDTSQLGATLTLDGSQIRYDPRSSAQLAELSAGGELVDSFQYTVEDGSGATATATVSVTVHGLQTIQFRMETTDLDGNVIDAVATGEDFLLQVYVEDVRDDAQGVFSPYLDVTYTTGLITPSGEIEYGDFSFPDTVPGKLDTPGLIDEVGAISGFSAPGPGEFLLFSLQFTAGQSQGTVTFVGDPADEEVLHQVLFFDDPFNAVPPSQIDYGQTSINVLASGQNFAALSSAALTADASNDTGTDSQLVGADTSGDDGDSPSAIVDAAHADLAQTSPQQSADSISDTGIAVDNALDPVLADIAEDVATV